MQRGRGPRVWMGASSRKCISRMPQSFRELKSVGKTPEAAGIADCGGEREGGKKRQHTFYSPPSRRCRLFFHAFYIRKPNIPPILATLSPIKLAYLCIRARALKGETRYRMIRYLDLCDILSLDFCLRRVEYELQTVLSDRLKFNMRRLSCETCLQFHIVDLVICFPNKDQINSTSGCSRESKSTLSLLKPFPILKYSKVTLCRLECISHTEND